MPHRADRDPARTFLVAQPWFALLAAAEQRQALVRIVDVEHDDLPGEHDGGGDETEIGDQSDTGSGGRP